MKIRLFQGNPAAVCALEAWLEDELLQAILAWPEPVIRFRTRSGELSVERRGNLLAMARLRELGLRGGDVGCELLGDPGSSWPAPRSPSCRTKSSWTVSTSPPNPRRAIGQDPA